MSAFEMLLTSTSLSKEISVACAITESVSPQTKVYLLPLSFSLMSSLTSSAVRAVHSAALASVGLAKARIPENAIDAPATNSLFLNFMFLFLSFLILASNFCKIH